MASLLVHVHTGTTNKEPIPNCPWVLKLSFIVIVLTRGEVSSSCDLLGKSNSSPSSSCNDEADGSPKGGAAFASFFRLLP